jgi:signal transduction histidine kinase
MKLRTKMIISFFTVVLLPITLFALTVLLLRRMHPSFFAVMSDASGSRLWDTMYSLGLIIVVILVITAALVMAGLYNSVIKPLSKLKKATREIKYGNLEFVLEPEGDDEISELFQDFDDMRKRLKESAEEKMQYDSDSKALIRNISHDLKTPITAIKGYCEGIMDGVASTPEKLDKYVRTIYNKANDMDKLIDELTIYSRIDTNRIPYVFDKINVADYFKERASELQMDLETQNIDLTYYNYLDDNDVTIIGDAEQLKRVVNNIVSNSVKYMDKSKGMINLRVRDADDFIQVEIEDNGRGIAPKDLPHIFDRFYRADASRNSLTGGSGIGLSIVRKVIEDHGGRIWATSKEGTGTVLHFVLRKYVENISPVLPEDTADGKGKINGQARDRAKEKARDKSKGKKQGQDQR